MATDSGFIGIGKTSNGLILLRLTDDETGLEIGGSGSVGIDLENSPVVRGLGEKFNEMMEAMNLISAMSS